MDHLWLSFAIFQRTFVFAAKGQYIDARLRETQVVFVFEKHQSTDFRLPQLEALMSEKRGTILHFARQISDYDIIGVDKTSLVRYD